MPEKYESFNFFPAQRRKIELTGWSELMNAQSEKRIRFDLQMPLTGENIVGMPGFIGRGFETMNVEESRDKRIDIDVELENVHFEAFSTDTCKRGIPIETMGLELEDEKKQLGRSHVKFSSATIRNFKLVRVTKDKQEFVALDFCITVKSDAGLCLFAHQYHGGTFWAVFSEAQLVVPKKDDPDQMNLGEPPTDEEEKREVGEHCPAADGEGGHCVLALNHEDPDHVFSNSDPVNLKPRQAKSRTEKEAEAKAKGKPRGFVQ